MELTVARLAEYVGAELFGEGEGLVNGVGPLGSAGKDKVSFVSELKYLRTIDNSAAAALIVPKRLEGLGKPQLVVKDVQSALIRALEIFAPELGKPAEGIDPTAKIGQSVSIGKTASVGPNVIIDDDVHIGEGTVIRGGAVIGQGSKIGRSSRIDANVVIYHQCTVGNNVIIQANSTIGGTGFGYTFIEGTHKLVPHNGGVVIEDFVEIGANTCIDRAKFGNTVIGAGTKIDNLVQIAHNVTIGKCCLIAGMVGIAGSCRLGDRVILAGQAGVVDHVEIGDGAVVGAKSAVTNNVKAGQQVFGLPATDKTESLKVIGLTRRLPKLREQMVELARRIERLELEMSALEGRHRGGT